MESGPPEGDWVTIADPDGHTFELTFGQHVGIAVELEG